MFLLEAIVPDNNNNNVKMPDYSLVFEKCESFS